MRLQYFTLSIASDSRSPSTGMKLGKFQNAGMFNMLLNDSLGARLAVAVQLCHYLQRSGSAS